MTGDKRAREFQILVIEDDFLKARLLVASLQTHLGTRQIFVARDGDQAFNLIREHDALTKGVATVSPPSSGQANILRRAGDDLLEPKKPGEDRTHAA